MHFSQILLQLVRPGYYIRCLREILEFSLQPRPERISKQFLFIKLPDVIVILIITLLFSLSAYYLTRIYIKAPLKVSDFRIEEEFSQAGLFAFIVLIVPFLEECMFRLPLKYTGITLSIALALLSFDLISRFAFATPKYKMDESFFSRILIATGFGIMFYLIQRFKSVKDNLQNTWRSHFKWIYYALIISFALMHMLNFQYTLIAFYLWPFITLPQLFLGVTCSFVRMHFGFFYGFLLHALYNSSFFWLPVF